MRQDKDKQEKLWVLILSGCVEKRQPPSQKGQSQRTEERKHIHDDLFCLAQSTQMCFLHFSFFSAEGITWQWTFRRFRPHPLLRNPMSITSTTFGTLCWNFCFTHVSAYPWKRYFAREIWCELHFLVILHRTSYATENETAYEKKTHSSTTSRTSQAGLEMTKRASGDLITFDNN